MPIAIPLGNIQHLLLTRVSLLALDVAISCLGQQWRGSGELPVAGVDLIRAPAGDDEEGDSIADLRSPLSTLVEARLDGGLRRIVPDHPVPAIGDHERYADARCGGGGVIMPALYDVAAVIEKTLLVLAEAIVVLV